MHVGNIAAGISAVFGVVVILAAALAVARANFAKAQIVGLRADVGDLTERCDRLKENNAELNAKYAAEKTARETLERTVTGRDLLEELRNQLQAHHKAAMDAMQKLYTAVDQLTDAIDARGGTR
jgi:chromosome segregation ATPase